MLRKTWVYALPVNKNIIVWDDDIKDYQEIFIDPIWARNLVDNTNRAIKAWELDTPRGVTPYYPPVLKEHIPNGWRGGDVLKAKITRKDNLHGVFLLIRWIDNVWSDIEKLNTQHISIGTVSNYTDAKGRRYNTLINELSLTENPRLKDIGRIQDYINLRLKDGYAPKIKDLKMNEVELLALIEELNAKYAEIESQLADLVSWKMEMASKDDSEVELEMEDKKEELEVVMEDMPKDQDKEEDVVLALADHIESRAIALAKQRLLNLRLGEIPAAKPPKASRPKDKLAEAKSKGLSGSAAILASLK